MKTCEFPDCERIVYARGWCDAHYTRWRKYGDASVNLHHDNRRGEGARFWEKVDKQAEGCWVWTAVKSPSGYGKFWADGGRTIRPHRWSYEQANGPIPDGLQIDHLCKNRACVNPAHLEAVTPRENTMRSDALGALNSVKTHCPQGHPYDEENTYVIKPRPGIPNGGRACRICRNKRSAAYNAKRRQPKP